MGGAETAPLLTFKSPALSSEQQQVGLSNSMNYKAIDLCLLGDEVDSKTNRCGQV